MIESFAARKYLQGALPFGQWAAASHAIGHDHAYIQQYIRRGVPRWLNERDRDALVRLYGLDAERLRPPAKSADLTKIVRIMKRTRGGVEREDQPKVDTEVVGVLPDEARVTQLLRVWQELPPERQDHAIMMLTALRDTAPSNGAENTDAMSA